MPIDVKNPKRTPFVLTLLLGGDYGDDPSMQPRKHTTTRVVKLDDGTRGTETKEKLVPASITWAPGETKENLPDSLREIAQFKSAITPQHKLLVITKSTGK